MSDDNPQVIINAGPNGAGKTTLAPFCLLRDAAGLKNFWKLYKPLADSWAVYDNSTFSEPRLVAKGSGIDPKPFIHTDLWSVFREAQD